MTTETADLIAKGMTLYPHPTHSFTGEDVANAKGINLTQWPRPIALLLKGVLLQYLLSLQAEKIICSPLSAGWLSQQNPSEVETGNFTLLDCDAPVKYQRQQILYARKRSQLPAANRGNYS